MGLLQRSKPVLEFKTNLTISAATNSQTKLH